MCKHHANVRFACAFLHVSVYFCISFCKCASVCVCVYTCLRVHVRACVRACICVHITCMDRMCVCVCVCVCVSTCFCGICACVFGSCAKEPIDGLVKHVDIPLHSLQSILHLPAMVGKEPSVFSLFTSSCAEPSPLSPSSRFSLTPALLHYPRFITCSSNCGPMKFPSCCPPLPSLEIQKDQPFQKVRPTPVCRYRDKYHRV